MPKFSKEMIADMMAGVGLNTTKGRDRDKRSPEYVALLKSKAEAKRTRKAAENLSKLPKV